MSRSNIKHIWAVNAQITPAVRKELVARLRNQLKLTRDIRHKSLELLKLRAAMADHFAILIGEIVGVADVLAVNASIKEHEDIMGASFRRQ